MKKIISLVFILFMFTFMVGANLLAVITVQTLSSAAEEPAEEPAAELTFNSDLDPLTSDDEISLGGAMPTMCQSPCVSGDMSVTPRDINCSTVMTGFQVIMCGASGSGVNGTYADACASTGIMGCNMDCIYCGSGMPGGSDYCPCNMTSFTDTEEPTTEEPAPEEPTPEEPAPEEVIPEVIPE